MKAQLLSPRPPRVLVSSSSAATRSLLSNMLSGFFVASVASLEEAYTHLRATPPVHTSLDFIILDDQSEAHAEALAHFVRTVHGGAIAGAQIVHLYTPTTDRLSGLASFNTITAGVTKMTKPPRQARLLHALADLKHLPSVLPAATRSDVEAALRDIAAARRTLFGNVLIAEGAPARLIPSCPRAEPPRLQITRWRRSC